MLSLVEARSAQGALLSLPLSDASSGIYIKEIGGLDPVKATLVSSSFAGEDGEQYHAMRREARDVTLKLGLEPDYTTTTVRALRARLYNYFMTGVPVNLRFYDEDGLIVGINGRVETCESPQFTAEPEMNVSVRCFKPLFEELTDEVVTGDTVATDSDMTINYDGTVETGILFEMTVNRDIGGFTIYHTAPDGLLRSMDFQASVLNGDKITISTVPGSKYAVLASNGGASILRGISPQSNWIELQPGPNQFRVYMPGAAIPWQITYTNRHGGL